MKKIGLIAGSGEFPLILAELSSKEGYYIVCVGIKNQTDEILGKIVGKMHWVELNEIEKMISIFKSEGIEKIAMAGKIDKTPILGDFKPDGSIMGIFSKLPDNKDETLLRAFIELLGKSGITVENSFLSFSSLLATEGILTSRKPSEEESDDIKFGYPLAKKIAEMDIGQTVVIKKKVVIAVEAMEGTDETILRAGKYGKSGNVVVKASRPKQDLRLDIPVVGMKTIEAMKKTNSTCLAVESGKSIILNKQNIVNEADKNGISIIVIDSGGV